MKKVTITVIAALVLGMAMTAMGAPPTAPPPGEHYTFNCVTGLDSFSDSFDSGLSNWTLISGTNSIVDDGGNNTYEHVGGSYVGAVAGSENWVDYVFEFDVKQVSGPYFNIVFRYTDGGGHYLLEPGNGRTTIALFDGSGGYSELARELQPTGLGTWYHYEVVVKGTSIKVYVDSALIIDVTDSSLSQGKIGIGSYAGSISRFDNIEVTNILKAGEILVPFSGSGWLGAQGGPTFQILDNDMTDDGQAWIQLPAGSYDTYDQARGKPGGDMFWGDYHARATKKPVWLQHNDPWNWGGGTGNWGYSNNGVTCYSFRLYPLP